MQVNIPIPMKKKIQTQLFPPTILALTSKLKMQYIINLTKKEKEKKRGKFIHPN